MFENITTLELLWARAGEPKIQGLLLGFELRYDGLSMLLLVLVTVTQWVITSPIFDVHHCLFEELLCGFNIDHGVTVGLSTFDFQPALLSEPLEFKWTNRSPFPRKRKQGKNAHTQNKKMKRAPQTFMFYLQNRHDQHSFIGGGGGGGLE